MKWNNKTNNVNNEKEKKINLSFGLMNEIYKIKNYDSWKLNRQCDMMDFEERKKKIWKNTKKSISVESKKGYKIDYK